MRVGEIYFVVNLLQDINILRPLAYLASLELNINTHFLVTESFRKRDATGVWQSELNEISRETHALIHNFRNEYEAINLLQDHSGLLVAASESNLDAHKPVHNLFRIAPKQYLKITLQHGFECVGFMQSRDQNKAHGSNIIFAADIICGWCASESLTSVRPSQKHKLRVTGPTSLLEIPPNQRAIRDRGYKAINNMGLVCENMHSPRLHVTGDCKTQFFDVFDKFCSELNSKGIEVALRPHPGGQYSIKTGISLPVNVVLENSPIYKVDISSFSYGISAPSSVLIDMVVAGIPTAVWQDKNNVMDLCHYEGLTKISTVDEWLDFANDAIKNPEKYRLKQQVFLNKTRMLVNGSSVRNEFTSLLKSVLPSHNKSLAKHPLNKKHRILFLAPALLPTLQLSFLKPLSEDEKQGHIVWKILTESEINTKFKVSKKSTQTSGDVHNWLVQQIDLFNPTVVVFCRWAGPHTDNLLKHFSKKSVPTIFHLDDDLLAIPKEIGYQKWLHHNRPERLDSIRKLLFDANLIYCSTYLLGKQLKEYGANAPIYVGDIYASGEPIAEPYEKSVKKIGYMGIGHETDFQTVLPAIVKYLEKNKSVAFEIFGTIPIPKELEQFGHRVSHAPKIDNYNEFLTKLAEYNWDIGICPLSKINFNFLKANTKWVEYTAVGIAVVASKGLMYDNCCSDGCGILAESEQEWLDALQYLTDNPEARTKMVRSAQDKLRREYSPAQLRRQIFEAIDQASSNAME